MTSKLIVDEIVSSTGVPYGEILAAKSQSLHIGTVVKAIVYDTSKDYLGGEWRKRCQDKSWYTETLGGDRWIGQQATIAAAWTAAGSVTGAVFQASATAGPITIGKYYSANSATTVTEVFRGITREFPAVAGIVAESGLVVIYDLSSVGAPMWMVFVANGIANIVRGSNISSISASGANLLIGHSTSGLALVNFASDGGYFFWESSAFSGKYLKPIAQRNSGIGYATNGPSWLVNYNVNDVALTVLEKSFLNPATGLPEPTIFVGTAGGMSVISNTGVVYNSSNTTAVSKVAIEGKKLTTVQSDGTVSVWNDVGAIAAATVPNTTYTASSVPAMLGTSANLAPNKAMASTLGLTLLKDNPAVPASGMAARITDKFNSGWMPGDIRGTYLADTVAETIVGSGELVTNGTFATDTSGWASSPTYTSTTAAVDGEIQVTVTSNYGFQTTPISCVVGKTYTISGTARRISGTGTAIVSVITSANGGALTSAVSTTSATAVSGTVSFIAPQTTLYVSIGEGIANNGSVHAFDNISVKLAEPDRSVKGP